MISRATSAGRYLPSADWAKRFCSDPTARAAAPTPMKASSQPAPQPNAGRSSVSIRMPGAGTAAQREHRRAGQARRAPSRQPRQLEGRWSARRAMTSMTAARQRLQSGSDSSHPAVELLRKHLGMDFETLHRLAGEARHRRREIVEVVDVAADQDVTALDLTGDQQNSCARLTDEPSSAARVSI